MNDDMASDGAARARELAAAATGEVPFMEQLAAAGLKPLVPPPQFVLVLQDIIDAEGNPTLEMAGVQRPEQFDDESPCHVVGRWLSTRMPQILQAARGERAVTPQQLRMPSQHGVINPVAGGAPIPMGWGGNGPLADGG